MLTMMLGSADEIHQRFVPQHTSTITDVGFDVCGGYFALMILFAATRFSDSLVAHAPAEPPQPRRGIALIALHGSTLSGSYSALFVTMRVPNKTVCAPRE
jgi:hypothetical protein